MNYRKLFAVMACLALMLLLVACSGSEKGDSGKEVELEAFKTDAVIESQLLYDEGGVRITANELTYGAFSAQLSVTVENTTDRDLSVYCGTMGYSVNSVNGYMVADGYLGMDINAGETLTDSIEFNYSTLNTYGVTEIADIEVGFNIDLNVFSDNYDFETDWDYESVYTGPISILTSCADEYDYTVNRYAEALSNGSFEKRFDCSVVHYEQQEYYNTYGVSIVSAAVVNNSAGEPMLFLEVKNNNGSGIVCSVKDLFINGNTVYDGLWCSDSINAGKTQLVTVSLMDLAEKYERNTADVSSVTELSFVFGVGENWYDAADEKEIVIQLPAITVPLIVENEVELQDDAALQEEEESEDVQAEVDSSEVRSDFIAAMDSYEDFMNEYVDFMVRFSENPDDAGLLLDYASYVSEYAEFAESFEAWEDDDLSDAELLYYLEVQARVSAKLLEIA